MKLIHIVAVDEKGGIGKDNKLLGHFPEDLKLFKKATDRHIVIMGYNTWLSLPKKPLPNRYNIVLAPKDKWETNEVGLYFTDCLKDAICYSTYVIGLMNYPKEVFIMGGAMLYHTTMDYASEYWITEIHKNFDADAFYPVSVPEAMEKYELTESFDFTDGDTRLTFNKFTNPTQVNVLRDILGEDLA